MSMREINSENYQEAKRLRKKLEQIKQKLNVVMSSHIYSAGYSPLINKGRKGLAKEVLEIIEPKKELKEIIEK